MLPTRLLLLQGHKVYLEIITSKLKRCTTFLQYTTPYSQNVSSYLAFIRVVLEAVSSFLIYNTLIEIITYQNSVVELHSGGIFKEVLKSGRECQQIIRDPSFSHLREGVIHQPSIQTSNKSTCVKAYAKWLQMDLHIYGLHSYVS